MLHCIVSEHPVQIYKHRPTIRGQQYMLPIPVGVIGVSCLNSELVFQLQRKKICCIKNK